MWLYSAVVFETCSNVIVYRDRTFVDVAQGVIISNIECWLGLISVLTPIMKTLASVPSILAWIQDFSDASSLADLATGCIPRTSSWRFRTTWWLVHYWSCQLLNFCHRIGPTKIVRFVRIGDARLRVVHCSTSTLLQPSHNFTTARRVTTFASEHVFDLKVEILKPAFSLVVDSHWTIRIETSVRALCRWSIFQQTGHQTVSITANDEARVVSWLVSSSGADSSMVQSLSVFGEMFHSLVPLSAHRIWVSFHHIKRRFLVRCIAFVYACIGSICISWHKVASLGRRVRIRIIERGDRTGSPWERLNHHLWHSHCHIVVGSFNFHIFTNFVLKLVRFFNLKR